MTPKTVKKPIAGLGALSSLGAKITNRNDKELVRIDVAKIRSKAQPRTVFEHIDELAASLKELGQLQPVVVSREADGTYVIEQGERRWRAAKEAGLTALDCVVIEPIADRPTRVLRQLTENIQRDDMKLWELVTTVTALAADGLSARDIARRLGKHETWVSNLRKLAGMPEALAELCRNQRINDPLAARALMTLHEEHPKEVAAAVALWSAAPADEVITRAGVKALADEITQPAVEPEVPATKKADKKAKVAKPVKLPEGCKTAAVSKLSVVFEYDGSRFTLTPGVIAPEGQVCLTDRKGRQMLAPVTDVRFCGVEPL